MSGSSCSLLSRSNDNLSRGKSCGPRCLWHVQRLCSIPAAAHLRSHLSIPVVGRAFCPTPCVWQRQYVVLILEHCTWLSPCTYIRLCRYCQFALQVDSCVDFGRLVWILQDLVNLVITCSQEQPSAELPNTWTCGISSHEGWGAGVPLACDSCMGLNVHNGQLQGACNWQALFIVASATSSLVYVFCSTHLY